MDAPILVAYATKHGSTQAVAATIAARLRDAGLQVELERADRVRDIERFRGLVLGGSLYTGRWHRDAAELLRRNRDALTRIPVAVFALGPRTLDPLDLASSRKQLERALEKIPELEPHTIGIFGGVIDPASMRFPFNRLPASDARDWDAIDAFAAKCARVHTFGKPEADTRAIRNEVQQTHR